MALSQIDICVAQVQHIAYHDNAARCYAAQPAVAVQDDWRQQSRLKSDSAAQADSRALLFVQTIERGVGAQTRGRAAAEKAVPPHSLGDGGCQRWHVTEQ